MCRSQSKKGGRRQKRDLGGEKGLPPVSLIGHDPAPQPEEQDWQEANEPQEANLQWVSGDLEDVPDNGDALDLSAEGGQRLRRPEQQKITVTQHVIRPLLGSLNRAYYRQD